MTVRVPPLTTASLLALTAVNAWLLTVLLQDRGSEAQPVVAKSEWRPKSTGSSLGMAGPKPLSVYGGILAQPIFFKSRQPFVPPPPAPPPPLKAPVLAPAPVVVDPGLVLGGVIITSHVKKAYVVSKANSEGTWAMVGETVMGWTVQSIDAGSAELLQGNQKIHLQLHPSRPQP
jgi:hypothetical protein